MKKYKLIVSGNVPVTISANSEQEAFDLVQDICSGDIDPNDTDIDAEECLAITMLYDYEIYNDGIVEEENGKE